MPFVTFLAMMKWMNDQIRRENEEIQRMKSRAGRR